MDWILFLTIIFYDNGMDSEVHDTPYTFDSLSSCEQYALDNRNKTLRYYIIDNYRDKGVIQVVPGCRKLQLISGVSA